MIKITAAVTVQTETGYHTQHFEEKLGELGDKIELWLSQWLGKTGPKLLPEAAIRRGRGEG